MTTEVDRRIEAGLRELAEAVHIPARPGIASVQAPAKRRWQPALAAAAVLLLLVLLPWAGPGGGQQAAQGEQPARLPSQLASFSFLTADVAQSPLDRVSLVYLQRNDWFEDYLQQWQTVLLDADGRRYRRADAVGTPPAAAFQSYPDVVKARPWLLSPDGRLLAYATGEQQVAVLEIKTGKVTSFTPPFKRARLLAWSPDGQHLAMVSLPAHSSGLGPLSILDLHSGVFQAHPQFGEVTEAAWSPDGSLLAVQSNNDRILFASNGGRIVRDLPLAPGYHLAGPSAWSPDGQLLALNNVTGQSPGALTAQWIGFLDVTGLRPLSAEPFLQLRHGDELQGWRSDRTVVLWDHVQLTQTTLDGKPTRLLAETGAEITDLQMAANLLKEADLTEPGNVDRGPWPAWASKTLTVIVAVPALIVLTALFYRRHRRPRPQAAPRDPAH